MSELPAVIVTTPAVEGASVVRVVEAVSPATPALAMTDVGPKVS